MTAIASPSSTIVRRRLSLLMFLLYATPGAWCPLFSLRLEQLDFSPLEMSAAFATQAIAAVLASMLAGQVADRWWPTERCVAIAGWSAAILLWLLAELTDPLAVILTTFGFWLMMAPAITLGTSLCFTHLQYPERDFGRVRLWGTIGWVVAGWLLGIWFADPPWLHTLLDAGALGPRATSLADTFRLGAVLSCILGCYALTLPHTPPPKTSGSWLAPVGALKLLRQRCFAIYCVTALGLCVTFPFYQQGIPLLLDHLGTPRPWLSPILTLAQSMEIVTLALLPMLLTRFGVKGTMLLGLLSWTTALFFFALGDSLGLIIAFLGCYGLCICCFLVSGQVFVNSKARGDIRASAQSLMTSVNGLGMLLGNMLLAFLREFHSAEFGPTFFVGACLAAALVLLFWVGFNQE